MEPLATALHHDACAQIESLGQVDGICDSPYLRPGQIEEVEGVEMEKEERSMKGWSQVRRKNSQEEKEVAAMTRGWEEFKSAFPYLAHTWRYAWSESEATRQELREDMVRRRGKLEREEESTRKWMSGGPRELEVEKWLREGGRWGK